MKPQPWKEGSDLPLINPYLDNQDYLGKIVKVKGEKDKSSIVVRDVTGQYFYGFDESQRPRIINVCIFPIELVPDKLVCSKCEHPFWQDELFYSYKDFRLYCKECLDFTEK